MLFLLGNPVYVVNDVGCLIVEPWFGICDGLRAIVRRFQAA